MPPLSSSYQYFLIFVGTGRLFVIRCSAHIAVRTLGFGDGKVGTPLKKFVGKSKLQKGSMTECLTRLDGRKSAGMF